MKRKQWLIVLLGALTLAGCGLFNSPEKQFASAGSALASGNYGEAVVVLRNLRERDPADAAVRLLLARALFQQGEAAAADQELRAAIERGADGAEVARLQMHWRLASGDFQSVLEVAEEQSTPLDQFARDYYRARALQGMGRTPEALALYRELADAQPDSADLQLRIAQCHAVHGREALALAALDRAMTFAPGETPVTAEAWVLRAALAQRSGDAQAAREARRKAIDAAPGQITAVQHAQLLAGAIDQALRAGDVDEAARHVAVLAKILPQAPLTRMVGAQVRLHGEQPASAVGELQQLLLEQPDNHIARGLLIAGLLRNDSLEQALREVGALATNLPAAQDLEQLRGLIRAASEQPAGSMERRVILARALLAIEQPALARALLEQALQQDPQSGVLRAALVRAELTAGRGAEALRLAQRLVQEQPEEVAAKVLLAEAQMAQQDFAAAADTYATLWSANRTGALALALAQTRRRAGLPGANDPLQQWLAEHPGDASVRLDLATALQQAGDRAAASREFQRLLSDVPSGHPLRPVVLNNLAVLYGQQSDPRALDMARQAHEGAPDVASVQDTYGWLLARRGRLEEALPLLRAAAQAAPLSAEIRYHYAAALALDGQRDAARLQLADVLLGSEAFEERAEAERLLAELR